MIVDRRSFVQGSARRSAVFDEGAPEAFLLRLSRELRARQAHHAHQEVRIQGVQIINVNYDKRTYCGL